MQRTAALTALLSLLSLVYGQQVGTQMAETHPKLSSQTCTKSGGCTTQNTAVVLDSNWRWAHRTADTTNCYNGNTWDTTICPDGVTCAKNCAIDGADYAGTYGITTATNALTLKFITKGQYSTNIGSRVYLMQSDTAYTMFKLKNQEFTFDVDVSNLPCGFNGALYFVSMDQDGGLSKFPNNKAGAKYGTGYCDSQCPKDIKFINGEANVGNWTPSANDMNAGAGQYGTCCTEMDIWEANSMAAAVTPHGCTVQGQTRCTGVDCGGGDNRHSGVCDADGCDFNSFRMGNKTFLGRGAGMTVDTTKKFTVVTQFLTADGTATGALSEIRRVYVQNGVVIQNSKTSIPGMATFDSVTENFCAAQKTAFGDVNDFATKGGFKPMSTAMDKGMVLVLSIWDDHAANMLWLDSAYPTNVAATNPGITRGACATTSGVPADVEANSPNASVIFSNIKVGDIGSTFASTGSPAPAPPTNPTPVPTTPVPVPSPTPAPGGCTTAKYGQCGGQGFTGCLVCASGSSCKVSNPFYSQCL